MYVDTECGARRPHLPLLGVVKLYLGRSNAISEYDYLAMMSIAMRGAGGEVGLRIVSLRVKRVSR